VVKDCEIYIPLEGLINLELERTRLEKELQRLEGLIESVNKKLSNESFVSRAPVEIVNKERAKLEDWQAAYKKIKTLLEDLK